MLTHLFRVGGGSIAILLSLLALPASAGQPARHSGLFVAYEIRFSVMEVDLTESHLSSSWQAYAVDGDHVEGYLRGYELHLDRFVRGGFYVGVNAGYYADTYEHTVLPDRIENETATVGLGLGYSRSNLFGVPHLHVDVSSPIRYYFNQIERTRLGDATVREHVVVNNLWLFVGYSL